MWHFNFFVLFFDFTIAEDWNEVKDACDTQIMKKFIVSDNNVKLAWLS